MLKKLLKYDLKWIYKVVIVFYILSFIFAIITKMFSLANNSLLFEVLEKITAGATIAMVISALINGIMRSWVRFIRNVYKDESYLTHTLPVPKKTIYLSKVLAAIITTLTSVIVAIICMFICYYSKENLDILKSTLELAATTYNTTIIKLLLVIFLVVFLEITFIILVGYTSIIIGHKSNKNKMVKTLIIGFGLYTLTMCLTLLIIYIFGLINNDIMNIITTNTANINAIKIVMLLAVAIYLIYNLIYYYIGKKVLEQGVNID